MANIYTIVNIIIDRLHRPGDDLNLRVEKGRTRDLVSNTHSRVHVPVDEDAIALLDVVASPSRQRILALLSQGIDHPEDLARKLKLRRQGVDKQLLELYKWGFVDRSAILPADGRPRIVYRLSERGHDLLTRAEALARDFREGILADLQRSVNLLEDKLAAGELGEDAFLKRRKELETRYAHFLGEAKEK